MGLLRGMARTAVVAGTATAVSNKVSRRQVNRWAAKDEARANEQAAAQAPPETAPAASGEDQAYDQIRKLSELHDQGILTQEEFEAKKKQLLGI